MTAFGFALKKLVGLSLLPVGLVLWLGVIGLILWLARPRRKLGPGLVALALAFLLALSLPVTGWLLLRPLEMAAGAYASPQELEALGVRDIVVLSGGGRQGNLQPGDSLGPETMRRTLEGIRLWRETPGAKLILSGGSYQSVADEPGELMASFAKLLGIPADAITVEGKSWDTGDQARILAPHLKGKPFALVTSASHMPRALFLFRRQGLSPIAAPADFRTPGFEPGFMDYLPQASGLWGSQTALYEYMGNLWAWLGSLW